MNNPDVSKRMQDIGRAIQWRLPERWGFFVMVFPFGEGEQNRCNYCSNAQREDVIKTIKEWLVRSGAEEEWMKDIK